MFQNFADFIETKEHELAYLFKILESKLFENMQTAYTHLIIYKSRNTKIEQK